MIWCIDTFLITGCAVC